MTLTPLVLIATQLMVVQTFSVIHKKAGWFDGKGSIEISNDGIVFEAREKKRRRSWSWPDIQYFDRVNENEFVLLTYEDQKLLLGRDRQYRFVITDGKMSDSVFRSISRRLAKPVTNRVIEKVEVITYKVAAKHLHTFGGCEGMLNFTENVIYYLTEHRQDSREWQLERDVQSVWSTNPYQLEVHAYDNNRREFSRTRIYKFQLKGPLDPTFYRTLKLKLYDLESVHLPMNKQLRNPADDSLKAEWSRGFLFLVGGFQLFKAHQNSTVLQPELLGGRLIAKDDDAR